VRANGIGTWSQILDNVLTGVPAHHLIDDLHNSSLIEKIESESDNELYWSVPLAARLFGLKKLETNRMQLQIKDDRRFLQLFGASQESDVKRGMQPRIKRLFGAIESRVNDEISTVEVYVPIVESVASQYPDTWLLLADLYRKLGSDIQFESTLERYIETSESTDEKRTAWEKLALHFQARSNYADELFARIQLAQLPDTDFETISEAVNRFNNILRPGVTFEFEHDDKSQIVQILILLMEQRENEADANDFSRLGWLYMRNNQLKEAESAARRGLEIDEHNEHCTRLLQRIQSNR
jgi:tetratricopeptide (TPR) repeat protein